MYLCSTFVLGFTKWPRTSLILLELLADTTFYFIHPDYTCDYFFLYTDTVGVGSPLEEDEGQQTSLSFAQVKKKKMKILNKKLTLYGEATLILRSHFYT